MVDLNYLLMGFVVGFAAGIFLAYKIAQHANNKRRPPVQGNIWSRDVGSGFEVGQIDKKRLR